MLTRARLTTLCVACLWLWAGIATTAQKSDPPRDPGARVPVFVAAADPGGTASEFTQPGSDGKAIADSVRDIQEAFTAGKPRWVRLVGDPADAVLVVGVTRRTFDEGPEVMSVYTDVAVGTYTFPITGAGDPWREAARSVVRQLDEWAAVNYSKLSDRKAVSSARKEGTDGASLPRP